jgi:hypothetical protein
MIRMASGLAVFHIEGFSRDCFARRTLDVR